MKKFGAKIAQEIDFGSFLLLSQGEAREEGKARQYILANTLEAFITSLSGQISSLPMRFQAREFSKPWDPTKKPKSMEYFLLHSSAVKEI